MRVNTVMEDRRNRIPLRLHQIECVNAIVLPFGYAERWMCGERSDDDRNGKNRSGLQGRSAPSAAPCRRPGRQTLLLHGRIRGVAVLDYSEENRYHARARSKRKSRVFRQVRAL